MKELEPFFYTTELKDIEKFISLMITDVFSGQGVSSSLLNYLTDFRSNKNIYTHLFKNFIKDVNDGQDFSNFSFVGIDNKLSFTFVFNKNRTAIKGIDIIKKTKDFKIEMTVKMERKYLNFLYLSLKSNANEYCYLSYCSELKNSKDYSFDTRIYPPSSIRNEKISIIAELLNEYIANEKIESYEKLDFISLIDDDTNIKDFFNNFFINGSYKEFYSNIKNECMKNNKNKLIRKIKKT